MLLFKFVNVISNHLKQINAFLTCCEDFFNSNNETKYNYCFFSLITLLVELN